MATIPISEEQPECSLDMTASVLPELAMVEVVDGEPAAKRRRLGKLREDELLNGCDTALAVVLEEQEAEVQEQVGAPEQQEEAETAAAAAAPVEAERAQPQQSAVTDVTEVTPPSPRMEEEKSQEPSLLDALAPKRVYICRVCSASLSSSSNRRRHEKNKHQMVAAHAPSGSVVVAVACESPARAPAAARTAPAAAASASVVIAQPAAIAIDADGEEEEQEEEEEDLELIRFATASLKRRRQSSSQSTSDDEEEDKSSTPPQPGPSHNQSNSSTSPSEQSAPPQGMQLLLTDEELQEGCLPFLQWLMLPPLTSTEALVKSRRGRLTSLAQLHPIKTNLRFILTMLREKGLVDKVDLEIFTRLDVCRTLFDILSDRGCGSVRFHALFLLVKKMLVFLSSREATARRQFILPTIYESYLFVEGTCSDSGIRRNQESRNRALLGLEATQQLLQGRHGDRQQPRPFTVPATWSGSSGVQDPSSSPAYSPPRVDALHAARAVNRPSPTRGVNNEMSKEELQLVTRHCMSNLHELMSAPSRRLDAGAVAARDRWFMCLLITATLCLGFAPRSQVLRQLRIGSSFKKHDDDGLYWIKILAEMSKHGKPVMFSLAGELTPIIDFYLQSVRPRLMAAPNNDSPATHDYLFVKRNASPRTDFSECTNLVTQQLGLRPINAHAFRSAVITGYYENGATQSDMNVLADIMAHDPITAARSYFRPNFSKAAVQANNKMASFLLQ